MPGIKPKFNKDKLLQEADLFEAKAAQLEQAKPSSEHITFFDPDLMAQIPWIFNWMTPYIDLSRTVLLEFTNFLGCPFWVSIIGLCFTIRSSLLPLMLVQLRKIGEVAKTFPIMSQIKRCADMSNFSKWKKNWK